MIICNQFLTPTSVSDIHSSAVFIDLPFLDIACKSGNKINILLYQTSTQQKVLRFIHVITYIIISIFLPNSIYICFRFVYAFTNQWTFGWFHLGPLWIILLYTFAYNYLCGDRFLVFGRVDKYLGGKLLRYIVSFMLSFLQSCLPNRLCQYTFPASNV